VWHETPTQQQAATAAVTAVRLGLILESKFVRFVSSIDCDDGSLDYLYLITIA
jgi:hypothetical protein